MGQDERLISAGATYWLNSSCTESVCRAITSAGVAMLAESNFAQIDGFDDAVELHGVAAGESLPSIVAVVCWRLRMTPTVALMAIWRRSSVSIQMQSA